MKRITATGIKPNLIDESFGLVNSCSDKARHCAHTPYLRFARQMEGAKEVKCSEFGDAVIAKI